ncbi:hypothetical protein [Paenibacillus tianjinensis]|uniref:Uncharacterized protein n=1 Tax=Paenibacillus tianjinensis TaxID=2810347 RepID=A0ABX7L9G5_9BACL|nr:hypothetical protein [Paenibacillus tianjinensis]QSF43363.1 hypothetical protein JRJ22_19040 [Paenibacillus tianjinensis]
MEEYKPMIIYLVEQFDHDSCQVISAYYKEQDAMTAVEELKKKDKLKEQQYDEWFNSDNEEDYDGDMIFGFSYQSKSIEVK